MLADTEGNVMMAAYGELKCGLRSAAPAPRVWSDHSSERRSVRRPHKASRSVRHYRPIINP